MLAHESIFERHYKDYLAKIKNASFEAIADSLGADLEKDTLWLSMFNKRYAVSPERIVGMDGSTPTYDICVILCRYILMCPGSPPRESDWVGFRDFKDSGPLVAYFSNVVEGAVVSRFTGGVDRLKAAAHGLGAYPPDLDVGYDLACQFDALAKVPMMLLFNDADEEFDATCSILFERRAQVYLDAECLAMLGHCLMRHLNKGRQPVL